MAKNKISEWSAMAANNTDIGGIDIAEGCAPSGINNAIRELMAQVKDQQTGTDADNFTVGGNLSVTGTTTLTGVPTAPTAASGTNTTQIATTAFVTAITSALGTMSTQNANAVAITGGTVAATFTGNLTGNVTGNATGSSGSCTGNSATVTNGVYTTDFTKSLSSSGYQKLIGGLIVQWGTNTAPLDGTSSPINYPIAFPNAVFVAVGQKQTPNPGAVNSAVAGILKYSLSQFQVFSEDIAVDVSWVAIGY